MRAIAVVVSIGLVVLAVGSGPGTRKVLAYGDEPSMTVISSSVNPSVYGQPVTLTATVTGGQGTPTGTVAFYLDNRGPYIYPLVGGVATFTPDVRYWETGAPGELGENPVDAFYGGDPVYDYSYAVTFIQLLDRADTTTVLTTEPNPSASGQAVVFTASVSPNPPSVEDCCRGGALQFYVDGYEWGPLLSLDVNNQVQATHDYLVEGSHVIKAKWWGDVHHHPSSAEVTQVVGPGPSEPPTTPPTPTPTDQYAAYLTVQKIVVNDSGGGLSAEDFPLFVDGNLVYSGVTTTVTAGETHVVTEQGQPGYDGPVFGGDCAADGTIVLQAAAVKTCTVTNDDHGLTATLTVVKDVTNDDGGTLVAEDFALLVDGRSVNTGVPIEISADAAHQVTEEVQPGYTEPEFSGSCDSEGTVILRPGESATCVLHNDDIPPILRLKKKVTNDNGGTAVPNDWIVTATAAAPNDDRNFSYQGGNFAELNVYAGVEYTLSESYVAGYTAGTWTCDGDPAPNAKITLALGEYVVCRIRNNDAPRAPMPCIVGWGQNDLGQGCRPAGASFVAIAAGGNHSLALRGDGTIAGWGDNSYGQRTPPAGTYVAIAAGGRHSLALRADGTIVGWGDNSYGQRTPPAGKYVAIAAGGRHSLALRDDGTIVGWGDNSYGQRTPPGADDFTAISAGGNHSLALRDDGTIVGWGDNAHGQRTPPAGTFRAIAAGGRHSLALRTNGTIVGWGDNAYGQRTPPAGVFITIAAGGNHSLALRGDGTIAGWGDNGYGQRTPPAGNDFSAISAGGAHSLALSVECRQPDGRIRKGSSAFLGNDVYNGLGTSQTKVGAAAGGDTITFGISVQNDGSIVDRFRIAAAGAAKTGFAITYWSGSTDITAAVVDGTYQTPVIAPGGKVLITAKVKIKVGATVGSSVTRLVSIFSAASPGAVDTVKFSARRK